MNEKMNNWYTRFCENKKMVKELPETPDFNDLARVAANLSYRASVLRAIKLNGKNAAAKLARQEAEVVIQNFLCETYNSKTIVDINDMPAIWEEIYKIYKNHNIDDYTYGNAQKWVNMSIKYYIILLSKFNLPYYDVINIPVFPVDRIMINHIKEEFNLSFDGNWSDCNDAIYFREYIRQVGNEVQVKYNTSLFEYELNTWNS